MCIVVTLPQLLPDEATQINALFAAGLQRLHLRKPELPEAALHTLAAGIDEQYRHRIAWHQYHHLAIRYGSRRLHFPEWMRLRYEPAVWRLLVAEQCILSTSIHAPLPLPDGFRYAFAGPVFDSISKAGYAARYGWEAMFTTAGQVAIGGIDAGNCQLLKAKGIQHIAVCGAVWQAADPVQAFLNIRHSWHAADPVCPAGAAVDLQI